MRGLRIREAKCADEGHTAGCEQLCVFARPYSFTYLHTVAGKKLFPTRDHKKLSTYPPEEQFC